MLLKHQANEAIYNASQQTPLHLALFYNHEEIIKTLINKKNSINMPDSSGTTPLHLAIEYNCNPEIIDLLLQQGAFLNVRNNHGMSPLGTAMRTNNIDFIKKVLAPKYEQALDIPFELFYAAICKNTEALELLLKKQHATSQ